MRHSSCASVTPPFVLAPFVLGHARMSLKPEEVSMTPLPLRSTHWPFSTSPMWTTELPARFVEPGEGQLVWVLDRAAASQL